MLQTRVRKTRVLHTGKTTAAAMLIVCGAQATLTHGTRKRSRASLAGMSAPQTISSLDGALLGGGELARVRRAVHQEASALDLANLWRQATAGQLCARHPNTVPRYAMTERHKH